MRRVARCGYIIPNIPISLGRNTYKYLQVRQLFHKFATRKRKATDYASCESNNPKWYRSLLDYTETREPFDKL